MKKGLKVQSIKAYLTKLLFPNSLVKKYRALINNGNTSKAITLLENILQVYPKHFETNKILGDLSMASLEWDKAILYYKAIRESKRSAQIRDSLSICYKNTDETKKYRRFMRNKYQKEIEGLPNHEAKLLKEIDHAMSQFQWEVVVHGLEKYMDHFGEKTKLLVKLSMVYQLIGESEKAKHTFQRFLEMYSTNNERLKKSYEKMTIFDNGETRIDFYKKVTMNSQVAVTFDSINMEWDTEPFSFKVLEKENLDIVAVRKRKTKTYQQDLTQFDFVNTVGNLVANYNDKVSYGFSLGAYNVLYFTSLLNFRIYAISPRLSIHPIYGRTKIIGTHEFKHNLSFPYNDQIAPIIVYDPKNKLDHRYVNEEIIKYFPRSIIIKTPYSGHGVAPFLLKTGQLKSFLLNVLRGDIPKYDRKNRAKSSVYLQCLGEKCLKRNKLNWALDLINRSLELESFDKKSVKVKAQVLLQQNKVEKAYMFLIEKIEEAPMILTFRNVLIDLHLREKQYNMAEKELEKALKDFGNRPSLSRRLEKLNASWSTNR